MTLTALEACLDDKRCGTRERRNLLAGDQRTSTRAGSNGGPGARIHTGGSTAFAGPAGVELAGRGPVRLSIEDYSGRFVRRPRPTRERRHDARRLYMRTPNTLAGRYIATRQANGSRGTGYVCRWQTVDVTWRIEIAMGAAQASSVSFADLARAAWMVRKM